MKFNTNQTIVIIGCSNLGSAIANKMSLAGLNVIIIDKKAKAFNKLPDSFSGYNIEGDASDPSILMDNKVEKADLVVVATDSDNVNIFISMMINKIFSVKNIVVRLNSLDKKELFDSTSIKVILPFSLSLDYFDELIKENK